ncbi:restriction endonuclease [Estrella lausannensis]|uniref:Restriction endonuclease n=1 Tax=Estrella lausannensis TaxID=483423 RepID=A0A0H5DR80_9BACT|nr:restriction endonuclease [Estrella lausannensis]CRX39191.1 restriction endonuclease [Estrella lausannensis]
MSIPDYQTCMLPLLRLSAQKKELSMGEAVDIISDQFKLSEEQKKQLLPSGSQRVIANRIGWAKTYLLKAGLLTSPKRGVITPTEEGLRILAKQPEKLNLELLSQYPSFQQFKKRSNAKEYLSPQSDSKATPCNEEFETPDESLAKIYRTCKAATLDELLTKILSCSFSFFEQLVIDLLLKLGYGGSREDAGMALGKSGDEGLDGVINEDRLGLSVIYLQAKRWKSDSVVGRPEIQKFAGALLGKNAPKGIFITTSSFSKEARDYASSLSSKIILIDGKELLDLMWEVDLGLYTTESYSLKKLDLDYLSEN